MIEEIEIKCADERLIKGLKHEAHGATRGFIVINSALGVKQSFYLEFARYLALEGYTVLTWDGRGIGESATNNPKTDQARMRYWAQIDLDAILNFIVDKQYCSWSDIIVVGHSAGAHLIGLCSSIIKVPKIIMIAAGTCHWSLYEPKYWAKMFFSWHIIVPFALKIFGFIPEKFGLGHDIPKGIILDLRNWSLKRDYLFSDETLGQTYYKDYAGDISAIGFSDDYAFSPKKAMEDLIIRFPKASTSLNIFTPQELNQKRIGHFGFFNKRNKDNWEKLILNTVIKVSCETVGAKK